MLKLLVCSGNYDKFWSEVFELGRDWKTLRVDAVGSEVYFLMYKHG